MTPAAFDPRAVWRSLPDDARETIGAAALALVVAQIGVESTKAVVTPYGNPWAFYRGALRDAVIDAAQPTLFEEDGTPRVPLTEGLG